jgi:hypothetical protein
VGVTLHDEATVQELAVSLFGRTLTFPEWGAVVGAPVDSAINVYTIASRARALDIVVRVQHPFIVGDMERRFFRADDGLVVLRNVHFVAQPFAPAGFGTDIFSRQVATLVRLGVARIEAEIAGAPGSIYNGYYTWARLGFDAPLSALEQRNLPAGLAGVTTIHALITLESGLERPAIGCWPGG